MTDLNEVRLWIAVILWFVLVGPFWVREILGELKGEGQ